MRYSYSKKSALKISVLRAFFKYEYLNHTNIRFCIPHRVTLRGYNVSDGSADGVTLSLDKVTKTRGHSPFPPCHISLAHYLSGSRHLTVHKIKKSGGDKWDLKMCCRIWQLDYKLVYLFVFGF